MAKRKRLLFTGPVLTASGYGVHARQLLAGLVESDQYDVYVESLKWGETPFLTDPSLEWIRQLVAKQAPAQPDVHVHVTIPNEFKRRAPLEIGVTAGIEVDRVSPQWLLKCNSEVDVVVVPSEHSRVAFGVQYQGSNGQQLKLEKPILVIPEGVDTAWFKPARAESELLNRVEVPDRNFVFTGLGLDKPQGRDRKNVTRLIEYFCKAFSGSKGIGLILKTSVVNGSSLDYEICKKRIKEIKTSAGFPDAPVFLVHGRVSETEMAGIYNDPRVLAAVSLTHGEGYGLPLIEAAACDLPVIATDWSGHLDFLTHPDGRKLFVPVEYDLTEVWQECTWDGVIEPGTRWAVAREADAITKLQKMALSSETPRKWAQELGQSIRERLNLKATQDLFNAVVAQACREIDSARPSQDRDAFVAALRSQVSARGLSLVYTMPMSAGDVFLSTGVVSALRRRHPGHRVYFATQGRYFDIIKDLRLSDGTLLVDELLEYQPWMQEVAVLEDVFDEVYTPNLAVQMLWSNWVHKGNGRHLLDEFAVQCGVNALEPVLPDMEPIDVLSVGDTWVAVHSGGQKSARGYAHWPELVKNIRSAGLKVVQVGASDDLSVGEVDLDVRGKTDHRHLGIYLSNCAAFVGIDSYPMHVAAACGTNVVALFGSSYATTTGPRKSGRGKLRVMETPDRNGCDRACYKDVCKVDAGNPCINNIKPIYVYLDLMKSLGITDAPFYTEHHPRIGGYIHLMNPKRNGYPFVQSINSMLGFCAEVIVVDGGSTDGTKEELEAMSLADPQLKVITREWDPEEPGMDGMQKAFGRAMVSPDCEFLWQQDADEVVHPDDWPKIVQLCKRFPADVDVMHLPVIELWGDDRHVRTDRHSWKWRLSRNNLRVTHGINTQARQLDPKTGRVFSKPGQSDGCEYIDIVTGNHLSHRGFYNQELERLRREDPEEYGRQMNRVFATLPSVWHYSWADLPRKVRNFRDFWNAQWSVLYQQPVEARFADVVSEEDVQRKAKELLERGGEHSPAPTFLIDREPPASMKERQ